MSDSRYLIFIAFAFLVMLLLEPDRPKPGHRLIIDDHPATIGYPKQNRPYRPTQTMLTNVMKSSISPERAKAYVAGG